MPGGLAAEALGMLWALLADFRSWGAVRTMTALDPRFENRIRGLNRKTIPADVVECVSPGRHEDVYSSLLKRSDAVLIVAPETNGILARLTAQAEKLGIPLLGSSASAAARAGNKELCSRLFCRANLPAPETRTANFVSAAQTAEEMAFPLVVKPVDGVGSEGVFRVDRISDLPAVLASVRALTSHKRILLQSFAAGVHASVSLLVAAGRYLPASLNWQLIESGPQFQYRGSKVPFDHPAKPFALELACSAAALIPGLRGYVGVDLILCGDRAQLIEINPRLTTSYVGLRQIAGINLAQAIWDACRSDLLPERIPLDGQVIVRKDDPATWGL